VVIVTLQDLTLLRDAEANVHRLSYFDTATGLPQTTYKRALLAATVTEVLERATQPT